MIDDLNQKVAQRVGVAFRKAGIYIRRVRGQKDESNAILRLADSLAGVIRETDEGSKHYKQLTATLEKEELLSEV